VAWQIVAGEAILVDLQTGRTLGLNSVGTAIWSHLDKGSRSGIVEEIVREFDVTPTQAARDVEEFLSKLERRGLLRA